MTQSRQHPSSVLASLVSFFDRFIRTEVFSGIVLIVVTILALWWSNGSYAGSYEYFWETEFGFSFGTVGYHLSLRHWINDLLMALFFLSVGLEIKHEVTLGKLSSFQKAALPVAGALGGMVVPALIYLFFNNGLPSSRGWGIPMATDIAFSLGIIALLGKNVPKAIRVFVAALAIADDLGAVVVIALFYTSNIALLPLLIGLGLAGILVLFNRLRVYRLFWYLVIGVLLWMAILSSGLHATVAGVILAMTIPYRGTDSAESFLDALRGVVNDSTLVETEKSGDVKAFEEERRVVIEMVEEAANRTQSPLHRLAEALSPLVAFVIVPLFVLANAGVMIQLESTDVFFEPVVLGIVLGLVAGKTLGVFAFSYIATKLKFGALPEGVNWNHMLGASVLCGIGFTMSLFIAQLAIGSDAQLFANAKIAILLASLLASLLGFFHFLFWGKRRPA